MNPETVTFLVGLACLLIGIFGTDWLVHRPARHEHAATVRDLRADLLETEQDLAEARAEMAGFIRSAESAGRDKARLVIALDNTRAERDNARAELAEKVRACASETEAWDRRYWLPTIEGVGLDLIDSLEPGQRLDWDFTDGTPIGLGVLRDHLAPVTELFGKGTR